MLSTQESPKQSTLATADKYLVLRQGGMEYGIDIRKVHVIIRLKATERMSRARGLVQSVTGLRGRLVPVVDLGHLLGTTSEAESCRRYVVVVKVARDEGCMRVGTLVDTALEVLEITAGQIRPPAVRVGGAPDFSLGIGRFGNRQITILNVDRLLSDPQITLFNQCGLS